jgi:hypothetical protein
LSDQFIFNAIEFQNVKLPPLKDDEGFSAESVYKILRSIDPKLLSNDVNSDDELWSPVKSAPPPMKPQRSNVLRSAIIKPGSTISFLKVTSPVVPTKNDNPQNCEATSPGIAIDRDSPSRRVSIRQPVLSKSSQSPVQISSSPSVWLAPTQSMSSADIADLKISKPEPSTPVQQSKAYTSTIDFETGTQAAASTLLLLSTNNPPSTDNFEISHKRWRNGSLSNDDDDNLNDSEEQDTTSKNKKLRKPMLRDSDYQPFTPLKSNENNYLHRLGSEDDDYEALIRSPESKISQRTKLRKGIGHNSTNSVSQIKFTPSSPTIGRVGRAD